MLTLQELEETFEEKINPNITILATLFEYSNYDGSCFILFEEGGKLYEVNGAHCSCYGFEDQWCPEETTWDALKLRKFSGYPASEVAELKGLIESH